MSYQSRKSALAGLLGTEPKGVHYIADHQFAVGEFEYLVLTGDEADEAFDRALDGYLDECILPQLPEHFRIYFDQDFWKRDAAIDGRGHVLAHYDGWEHEVGEFFIYRIN